MVDYPTDLDLDDSKDIHLNGANDLATVSGIDQLSQSVAIDVMDEIQDFIGGRVTGKNIGLLEGRIHQGLNNDPQLNGVQAVNIEEYDRRDNSITMEIVTIENKDFTIEVTS